MYAERFYISLFLMFLFFSLRDPLKGMFHEDFFKLIAKYKFAAAMENGICNDYVTEKLWRPLYVGTIPIVIGSPRIKVKHTCRHNYINVHNALIISILYKINFFCFKLHLKCVAKKI